MDPERHRKIASEGGKRAHSLGRAHRWTSAEAKKAANLSKKSKARKLR